MVGKAANILEEIENIKRAPLRPAYLIYGNDEYLEKLVTKTLCQVFRERSGSAVEHHFFYGDNDEDAAFFDQLTTFGMFSNRKIIVYRNIGKLDTQYRDRLIEYLKHLVPEVLLIMIAPADVKAKLVDTLRRMDNLAVIAVWVPTPENYPRFVSRLISGQGYEIDPEALNLLATMTNDNLSHTMAEWEKICLYVGDRKKITVQDVQIVVSGTKEYDMNDFIEAIARRDSNEAVRICLALLQADVSVPFFITQLYDLFVNTWAYGKIDLNGVFWRKKKMYEEAAKKFRSADFGAIFRALRKVDLMSKTTNLKDELMVPLIYEILG